LLQVEAALLNEDHVLVANGFLGWYLRYGDTRPPLLYGFVKDEEFIVAAESLPIAEVVIPTAVVNNVPTLISRILNSVAHGVAYVFS